MVNFVPEETRTCASDNDNSKPIPEICLQHGQTDVACNELVLFNNEHVRKGHNAHPKSDAYKYLKVNDRGDPVWIKPVYIHTDLINKQVVLDKSISMSSHETDNGQPVHINDFRCHHGQKRVNVGVKRLLLTNT